MRKRTKQRVVWLPPDQTNDAFGANVTTELPAGTGIGGVNFNVSGSARIDTVEVPIVIDTPRDPATESLADLEDSGYRLRRIVGELWLFGDRFDEDSGIEEIFFEAGLIVRRCDQQGLSLAALADTGGAVQENVSPASALNWADPWIWQRSWWTRNPNFVVQTVGAPAIANTTPIRMDVEYHMDQKTARIVGPEERLYLSASVIGLGGSNQGQINNQPRMNWSFRALATPRTSVGNRRNASR